VVKLFILRFKSILFFIRRHLSTSIELVNKYKCHCPLNKNIHLDLLYVQHVKSMGNRQTFHPKNLDYDLFNIDIELSPITLLLHGLFLKKLWWVKVSTILDVSYRVRLFSSYVNRRIYSVGIKCITIYTSQT
jgi:hypothetical protein